MGSKVFAKIAEAAYSPTPPQVIDGFTFDPNMSNDRIKVYHSGNDLIIGIRGTKVTNANDLIADLHILKNTLRKDESYRKVKQQIEHILSQKIIRNVILTGHSLGGAMVVELLTEFPTQISAAYVFNSGIGIRRFISDMAKKLMCKVVPFTRQCKELKLIRKKLHVFTTGSDPISLLTRWGPSDNINVIKPLSRNVHSISNFTKLTEPEHTKIPTDQVVESLYQHKIETMGPDNETVDLPPVEAPLQEAIEV